MSKTYDFLKECGTYFLTTVNDGLPAARPFGAIMEYQGELFFPTGNTKDVYAQLIKNKDFQIVALKAGTRDWIRINGKAIEVTDYAVKQAMLDACPSLLKKYDSSRCSFFAVFKIVDRRTLMSTKDGFVELD